MDFPIKKWWFSIVMLVYQRVKTNPVAQWCIMVYHVPSFSHEKQQSWGCILHFRATFWALASTVHQGSASSSIKRRSGQISLLWLLNSVDCCYGAFGTCSHVGMGHDGSQNLYVLNDLPFIWRNSMFITNYFGVWKNQDARVGPIHRFLRRSWAWAAPDIGWWGVPN